MLWFSSYNLILENGKVKYRDKDCTIIIQAVSSFVQLIIGQWRKEFFENNQGQLLFSVKVKDRSVTTPHSDRLPAVAMLMITADD